MTLCYPFLAAGRPALLPGIEGLRQTCRNTVVVATMDLFHHGIRYVDMPYAAKSPCGRPERRLVYIRAGAI